MKRSNQNTSNDIDKGQMATIRHLCLFTLKDNQACFYLK